MTILIADPTLGAFLLRGEAPPVPLSAGAECPCMPAACPGRLILACEKTRSCFVLSRKTLREELRFPAPPGISALCASPCGRWLYILSHEADVVHALHLGTGELSFAAPAGVFPRSMTLNPSGSELLVACGAEAEARLFSLPGLLTKHIIHTRHPCFGAAYWKNGLVLVCAAEGTDIQTILYTLAPGKVRPRELLRLPGLPGAMQVCPDGLAALLSTPDGLMKIDLTTGRLLWNVPAGALCMGISVKNGRILVSDLPTGKVLLLPQDDPWPRRILWQGSAPQACFL